MLRSMAVDFTDDDVLKALSIALRGMTKKQKIYPVVRDALIERGNWRNKPRGKPMPENLRTKKATD